MVHGRTRVKICGLTREGDIHCAVQAGADAIGFVFYPKSSRFVSLDQARGLRACVPTLVSAVALFVNASPDEVRAVIAHVKPDVLQFHGDEPPEYCAQFDRPYWKAFRVGGPGLETPQAVLAACRQFPGAAGWLFDSYSSGYGGSGLKLDTGLLHAIAQDLESRPMVLAGGLAADSVGRSIQEIQPYAVDVSSGVEVSGGIKSPEKIHAFMDAVKRAARPASRFTPTR